MAKPLISSTRRPGSLEPTDLVVCSDHALVKFRSWADIGDHYCGQRVYARETHRVWGAYRVGDYGSLRGVGVLSLPSQAETDLFELCLGKPSVGG